MTIKRRPHEMYTAWTPKFNKKTQGWEWDGVPLNQTTHSHLTVRRGHESVLPLALIDSSSWRRWSQYEISHWDRHCAVTPELRVISVARQSPGWEHISGLQIKGYWYNHKRLTNKELEALSNGLFPDGRPVP